SSSPSSRLFHFSSNAPATTAIYPLSLHDALPISRFIRTAYAFGYAFSGEAVEVRSDSFADDSAPAWSLIVQDREIALRAGEGIRSEEHTSELQSLTNLVCRLLLEKKKSNTTAQCS